MKKFGLIGRELSYSFSPSYFEKKFSELGLVHSYELLEFPSIERISAEDLLNFNGLNVTIPYKESIIPLLHELSDEAIDIGAVNCIQRVGGKLIGHNTDVYGFRESIRPFLKNHHQKALILGTGGASKAIAYALKRIGIEYLFVSRESGKGNVTYEELNSNAMRFFPFIINATPLGTYPDVEESPDIPYEHLSSKNFLYDLVYNPSESQFLRRGKANGAQVMNGSAMLIGQAERSWEIWNRTDSGEPAIEHNK